MLTAFWARMKADEEARWKKERGDHIYGLISPGDYEYSGETDCGKSYRFKVYVEEASVSIGSKTEIRPFMGIINEKNDTLVKAIDWHSRRSSDISEIFYYHWGEGFYHIALTDGDEYIMSNSGTKSWYYSDIEPQYTDGKIWFEFRENNGAMGAFMEADHLDSSGQWDKQYSTIVYPSIYTLDIMYKDDRFSVMTVDRVWHQTNYTLSVTKYDGYGLPFLYQCRNVGWEIPYCKSNFFDDVMVLTFRSSYCYCGSVWLLWGIHPHNEGVTMNDSKYLPVLKQLYKDDDNYAFIYACYLSGNIDATAPTADDLEGNFDCDWIKVETPQEYRQYMDEKKARQIFVEYFSKDVIKSCFDLNQYIGKKEMRSLVHKRYPELSLPDKEQSFILTDTINHSNVQPIQGKYSGDCFKRKENLRELTNNKWQPGFSIEINDTFIRIGNLEYKIEDFKALPNRTIYDVYIEGKSYSKTNLVVENYCGSNMLVVMISGFTFICRTHTAPTFGIG